MLSPKLGWKLNPKFWAQLSINNDVDSYKLKTEMIEVQG